MCTMALQSDYTVCNGIRVLYLFRFATLTVQPAKKRNGNNYVFVVLLKTLKNSNDK